jgi:hypothetical protein
MWRLVNSLRGMNLLMGCALPAASAVRMQNLRKVQPAGNCPAIDNTSRIKKTGAGTQCEDRRNISCVFNKAPVNNKRVV